MRAGYANRRYSESLVDCSIYCNYTSCEGREMAEKVSTVDVRQRIGDLLNRVALRHDEFVIERKGKPLAALVPIERLEQMRRFARRHALELLEKQKQSSLSEEQALEVGLEAQRSARKRTRKFRRRTR